MAFENLAQGMGNYSGQMLQAAIAARESALKEQNMRLQAPLAMAQTVQNAMGQWQQLDAQKEAQSMARKELTLKTEAHAMDMRTAESNLVGASIGQERMRGLMDAEIMAANLGNDVLSAELQQLLQQTKNLVDMTPLQVQQLQVAIDAGLEQVKAAKATNNFNEATESTRAALADAGLGIEQQRLKNLESTGELNSANLLLLNSQVEMTEIERDALYTFMESHEGNTPEMYELTQRLKLSNPHQQAYNVRTALAAIENPTTADIYRVLAKNFDPAFLGAITSISTSRKTTSGTPIPGKAFSDTLLTGLGFEAGLSSTIAQLTTVIGQNVTADQKAAVGGALNGSLGMQKFYGEALSALQHLGLNGMPVSVEQEAYLAQHLLANQESINNQSASAEGLATDWYQAINGQQGLSPSVQFQMPNVTGGALSSPPPAGAGQILNELK